VQYFYVKELRTMLPVKQPTARTTTVLEAAQKRTFKDRRLVPLHVASQQMASLFDHLVGAQHRRHDEVMSSSHYGTRNVISQTRPSGL
jgi:hypothetical protein